MAMTTTGAGYGLVPPQPQEENDMSKEAELMATYKVKITKPVFVHGEVAYPGDVVEVTRSERDTLLSGEQAVDVKASKDNVDKPKAK